MGRITTVLAIIFALFIAQMPTALAATTSTTPVAVTAGVDEVLVLDMTIKEENPDGTLGATVTSMPFSLVRDGSNALRGNKAYHVFLGTNTSGRNYNVTSTLGNLVNTGTTLPNALGLFPVGATDVDGVTVPGGTLATDQSAIGTNKLIYTNTQGKGAIIELVYGISGGNADASDPFPGWAPIPPDQKSGTYTASPSLTYTITTT